MVDHEKRCQFKDWLRSRNIFSLDQVYEDPSLGGLGWEPKDWKANGYPVILKERKESDQLFPVLKARGELGNGNKNEQLAMHVQILQERYDVQHFDFVSRPKRVYQIPPSCGHKRHNLRERYVRRIDEEITLNLEGVAWGILEPGNDLERGVRLLKEKALQLL